MSFRHPVTTVTKTSDSRSDIHVCLTDIHVCLTDIHVCLTDIIHMCLADIHMCLQGGEGSWDPRSCRSFSTKEPLHIGHFCGK